MIGNGTTPVNISEFYYLATVDDTIKDDYNRSFPGNSAFNQSEQSVQCYNDSNSIFVHIIDSCPAFQIKNDTPVQQLWCNSDIYHFDLSYWAFEQLAHPTYGVMMVDFRYICYMCAKFTLHPCERTPRFEQLAHPMYGVLMVDFRYIHYMCAE